MESACREPEEVGHVRHLIVGSTAEMNPSEYQREGDHHCQYTSPEDQLMHCPTQPGAFCDERLSQKMSSCQHAHVTETSNYSSFPEQFPAARPVDIGGRFPNPDRVVVNDAPGRKNDGERIDHQCRVEVLQIA